MFVILSTEMFLLVKQLPPERKVVVAPVTLSYAAQRQAFVTKR